MCLDNSQPQSELSASGASLRKMLVDVIPNARFAPIPDNHQIYHSFFDFDDGPPQGSEVNLHLSLGKSNSGESVSLRAHRTTSCTLRVSGSTVISWLCIPTKGIS